MQREAQMVFQAQKQAVQSTEIWEELVVFLGESALSIESGVPVLR